MTTEPITLLTSDGNSTKEAAITEMATLNLSTYTPVSRERWERNQAVVEKLLAQVFGHEKALPDG